MAKAGEAGRLHRNATVIDMVCLLLVRERTKLGNLTALLRRGFGEKDVRKIMGENLVRVFTNAWK